MKTKSTVANRGKQPRAQLFIVIFVIACSATIWPGCQSSDQTGEVGLYKIAPVNLSAQAERSSALYLLRERGFTVSENQFRLSDVMGDVRGAGAITIRDALAQLFEDSYRAKLEAERLEGDQSPKTRKIVAIHTNVAGLLTEVDRIPATDLARESHLNQVLVHLTDSRNFLEDLDFSLRDARDLWKRGQNVDDFDVMFRVMGHPLLSGRDWKRARVLQLDTNQWKVEGMRDGNGKAIPFHARDAFTELDSSRFDEHFQRLSNHWANGVTHNTAWQSRETSMKFSDLRDALYFILEDSLNLAAAMHRSQSPPPVENRPGTRTPKDARDQLASGVAKKSDGSIFLRQFDGAHHIHGYKGLDYAFGRIQLNLQKANYLISQIEAGLRQQMNTVANQSLKKQRVETEQLAEVLADLTQRRMFRKLKPAAQDKSPAYVTFMLKTLYLRHLGSGSQARPQTKNNELLVTCGVKHAENAEENVYPVIFEENYAPSFFVNRLDRIIYGPAAYKGQMLDIRLTVLELDDLDNQAITSGFASLTATIGAFNPEFSALAPAVNALFGTLVKAATENDRELDVSFTIPQPEGDGMADTDFLVAETGHYIIIKTENPMRKEVSAAAAKRQLYRRLIYNPEDGKLYHRKFFNDPKANFSEEYLFTAQNYAVIVVTDEYTTPDDLGEQLRKQVSRSLGEARGRELIPDQAKAREFLNTYRTLTGTPDNLPALDGTAFAQVVTSLKDELWQPGTALRKQSIAEIFHARADSAARLVLGDDPEKWKKAALIVSTNGVISLEPKSTGTNN